jgi:hypothetical protein
VERCREGNIAGWWKTMETVHPMTCIKWKSDWRGHEDDDDGHDIKLWKSTCSEAWHRAHRSAF